MFFHKKPFIEKHKAEQAQPAHVIVDDNDGQPMISDPQTAPAFKVGDRVEVVAIKGNPIGTITSDTPHMDGCYVSIDGAESGWVGYSNLRPAPAEQKPEAAFGGPHDAEAVKWAKERGYRVVEWRPITTGDRYIAWSADGPRYWNEIYVATDSDRNLGSRYILAQEAAKVDTFNAMFNALLTGTQDDIANAIDAHMRTLIQEANR